ncbi:putative membrane protein [Evansella caseinilytica]|uniref:Putative membrane protein n=1 Tax=Evansella caseinilytica TaxID=1503961 RepID=A0A1H3NJI5_9BACI|nr:putative membrane protein [Evansella caseinilytica]
MNCGIISPGWRGKLIRMTSWRRQHYAAIFISFLNNIKELLLTMLIVFVFGQSSQVGGAMFYTFFYGSILLFSLGSGVIKWLTFQYRLEADELKIKQGFLFKKNRFIRKERIQSIDVNAKMLQRMFRLVELRIETAGGGGEPEFRIVALKQEEAALIKKELLSKDRVPDKGQVTESVSQDDSMTAAYPDEVQKSAHERKFRWELSNRRLVIAALTSSGVGLAVTFAAAATSQLQQLIPEAVYEEIIGWLQHSSFVYIGIVVAFVLFISWVMALINTMLKYGQFTIVKNGDEIHLSRGILEKRQLTLSQKRITAVRIVQNLLRQPFGYVSVYVESACGGRKEEDLSTILIPLCKRGEITELLGEIVPEYAVKRQYAPLPSKSIRKYMIKLIVPAVVSATVIAYFLPYGSWALILPVLAASYGYWQYRDAGIGHTEGILLLKYRTLSRCEVVVPRKRIQAMQSSQTFLQRINDLHTIHVSVMTSIAGKTFTLKHIDRMQQEQQFHWYSYEEKRKE